MRTVSKAVLFFIKTQKKKARISMANMKKHGLKRLLAFLLLAVCLCGVFPSQAFAASVGQKASSWLGDAYVGSDGRH